MPRFLISILRPTDYDDRVETAQMAAEIDALNDDMVSANVRRFVCGVQPIQLAKHVLLSDGEPEVHPGQRDRTERHVGGFWVLELNIVEEAEEWAVRAARACRADVEIRPIYGN